MLSDEHPNIVSFRGVGAWGGVGGVGHHAAPFMKPF